MQVACRAEAATGRGEERMRPLGQLNENTPLGEQLRRHRALTVSHTHHLHRISLAVAAPPHEHHATESSTSKKADGREVGSRAARSHTVVNRRARLWRHDWPRLLICSSDLTGPPGLLPLLALSFQHLRHLRRGPSQLLLNHTIFHRQHHTGCHLLDLCRCRLHPRLRGLCLRRRIHRRRISQPLGCSRTSLLLCGRSDLVVLDHLGHRFFDCLANGRGLWRHHGVRPLLVHISQLLCCTLDQRSAAPMPTAPPPSLLLLLLLAIAVGYGELRQSVGHRPSGCADRLSRRWHWWLQWPHLHTWRWQHLWRRRRRR
mmetsp:Transcript_78953/g.156963  ORF Transcript_78953/g.156963 Transcript_78953/m.156963 type:complete len:315 (-) Transcript_78953:828-1772(-)